jgi:hypothetical protein
MHDAAIYNSHVYVTPNESRVIERISSSLLSIKGAQVLLDNVT